MLDSVNKYQSTEQGNSQYQLQVSSFVYMLTWTHRHAKTNVSYTYMCEKENVIIQYIVVHIINTYKFYLLIKIKADKLRKRHYYEKITVLVREESK